jgi:AhpD family alkylhydroperoxidase
MSTTFAHSHEQRMNLGEVLPGAYAALIRLDRAAGEALDPTVYELVKLRASQLNGCAYCLDMHSRDAREKGESQQRLDVLSAWREAPSFFSEREQAALAFVEAVTLLSEHGVPDAVWDAAAAVFEPTELAGLLTGCIAINAWNRVAVPTRLPIPEAA